MTGATRGFGAVALEALLRRDDANVTVLARDPGALPDHARLRVIRCDLGSLQEVRAASASVGEVDLVVANAGVQVWTADERTVDGFERTFATNHLAHLELLRAVDPPRVVVTSSGTHFDRFFERFGYPAPQLRAAGELATPGALPSGQVAYSTSKLANALTVTALAAQGRHAVAFDPGLVPGTGLARAYPAALRWAWDRVLPALPRLRVPKTSTPARSGAALAALGLGERAVPSRAYVQIERVVPASPVARDPQVAARLWDESLALLDGVAT